MTTKEYTEIQKFLNEFKEAINEYDQRIEAWETRIQEIRHGLEIMRDTTR